MKKVIKNMAAITAMMFVSTAVFAATKDAGAIADGLTGQISSFGRLGYALAFILGLFSAISGLLGVKKYADNPQQNPLTKPLIYTVVGVLLMGFTGWIAIAGSTVTGDDSLSSNADFEFDGK